VIQPKTSAIADATIKKTEAHIRDVTSVVAEG
jgi:hypothetical protein